MINKNIYIRNIHSIMDLIPTFKNKRNIYHSLSDKHIISSDDDLTNFEFNSIYCQNNFFLLPNLKRYNISSIHHYLKDFVRILIQGNSNLDEK